VGIFFSGLGYTLFAVALARLRRVGVACWFSLVRFFSSRLLLALGCLAFSLVLFSRLRRLVDVGPALPRFFLSVWGLGFVFVTVGSLACFACA
ncbi:hypothetical protein ACOIDL_27975, partial [Klebsiella pneumoniae]